MCSCAASVDATAVEAGESSPEAIALSASRVDPIVDTESDVDSDNDELDEQDLAEGEALPERIAFAGQPEMEDAAADELHGLRAAAEDPHDMEVDAHELQGRQHISEMVLPILDALAWSAVYACVSLPMDLKERMNVDTVTWTDSTTDI